MEAIKKRFVPAAVGLLLFLTCMACARQAPEAARSPEGAAPQDRTATEPDDPLEGFVEGPQLPDGWPASDIPLPPGSAPVAALAGTPVPGTPGEASTVFFGSEQTPEQIRAFLGRELPAKGWTIIESSPAEPFGVTAAEGHGYVMIIVIGTGFGPSQLPSGEQIAFQVTLAKES